MKILFTSVASLLLSALLPVDHNQNHTNDTNLNYIADNYYVSVYQADSLFIEGNYDKSYEILNHLFQDFSPVNMEIYNEYKTYVKSAYIAGNSTVAFNHFKNLISKYGISWAQITHDNVLNSITKENDFGEESYTTVLQQFEANIDNSLVLQIKSLKEKLQFYQNLEKLQDPDMENKIENFKKEFPERIKTILNTYGYPSITQTGKNAENNYIDLQDDFYLLLENVPDAALNSEILPLLKTLVTKGSCDPKTYAKLYDFYLAKHHQKQKFGTINCGDKIQNTSDINHNRKSIGLPSYGYEHWRFENLHPVDLKK